MSSWFAYSSTDKSTARKAKGTASAASATSTQDDISVVASAPISGARRRSDEGAIFTSKVCPSGPGLENTCELPFGFVWTPMAVCETKAEDEEEEEEKVDDEDSGLILAIVKCDTESLPPVLCLACLAYMNPFCEMDYKTGVWTCPLCEHENVVSMGDLKDKQSAVHTALNSTLVEYRQPAEGDPNKMDSDSDDEDYCTYVLVVDENLAPADGRAIAPAMEELLDSLEEVGQKVRIGLVVFGKAVATYQLGLSSGLASSDMYMTNEPAAAAAAEGAEDVLEKRSYLYEVEDGEETLGTLRTCLSAVFGVEIDEDKEHSSSILSRMDVLRSRKDARVRKQSIGKENSTTASNTPVESPWVKLRKESKGGHPKRCTGEAVQCALDLTGMNLPNPSRTSRIILFTNGCPNTGEGSVVEQKTTKKRSGRQAVHDVVDSTLLEKAVEYYDTLAKFAVASGIGFDVFCSGPNELAMPTYQALVEPSGGYVIPKLSFEGDHLSRNLKFVLENTYMSRSRYIPEELDDGSGGAECILDIRTDGFITPTSLCGSGEVMPGQASRMVENERSAFAAGSALAAEMGFKTNNLPSTEALEVSMTRIQVGRVDPLSTFAVMLEVDDSMSDEDEFAFFQMVVRHISRNGREEVTRVCSFRLPVAKDVNEYVSGVDDEAVSVILAKSAVYRALHGREETDKTRDMTASGDSEAQEKLAYESQLDLDATVQRISGAFKLLGLEQKMQRLSTTSRRASRKSSESSIDFAFPPELKETLNRLYHLRRGPLISPGPMRSIDDRAEMRGLFLRFPLEDCLLMMSPSVWSTGILGGITSSWDVMQEFPADTLALWDSSIVAADFHDSLFVWSGKNCTASRYDGVREKFKRSLMEGSEARFPMPDFYMLNDGDSMSRRFTTRLAPSHADSEENQLLHFPALSSLKPDALNELRKKFKFYDSNADASFRKWFWSVSSATNASREEGRSLCE